jgi:phage shock protein E
MNKGAYLLAVILLFTPALASASEAETSPVDQAWELIDGGALLIDVRTPEEYAAGHLDGAVNIPYDLTSVLAYFIKDPNRSAVVYCRSGGRAGKAQSALAEMGFDQVVNGTGFEALLESKP